MKSPGRKKEPELVRARLLRSAAELAADRGLSAVTIAETAKRAGVSTGGLFHHFPSKGKLIEALVNDFMERFEAHLVRLMARDQEPRGRFTRAYLRASLDCEDDDLLEGGRVVGLAVAIALDSRGAARWASWMTEQLLKNGEDPSSALGRIIRYAADGLWLEANVSADPDRESRLEVMAQLMAMTRQL